MVVTLGVDAGNYKTKAVNLENQVSFYSDVGEYRERNLVQSFGPDDMVVEYCGRRYFAGSLAKYESELGGTVMGNSKAHGDAALRVLLAICRHSPGGGKFNVVVGQPVSMYSDEEKSKIESALKGRHEITVNDQRHCFSVEKVGVAPEGAASLWSDPADGLLRILDIGSATINAATIIDRRYIDKESTTINIGMNTISTSDKDTIAEGIVRQVLKKWNRNDLIRVTGGAAYEMVKPLSRHLTRVEPLVPVLGSTKLHPAYANAVGFYRIARGVLGGAG